ncbi:MAG: Holliday junction resolvase RuvX [Alphaproteobacteria bacterium]|nr:Holliday junction resolvase RuvX [Alphaproteobacteria bacterium]
MAICNPMELRARLAPDACLIGLDVGEKTIGIAFSDPSCTIATPYETLQRSKFRDDVEKLKAHIASHHVGGIVVGLPINMNGTEGPRCQSTRAFADNLLQVIDLPLVFWDERLSTAAVTRTLLEADLSRKRRREVVDKLAAAYILQGLLDSYAALKKEAGP